MPTKRRRVPRHLVEPRLGLELTDWLLEGAVRLADEGDSQRNENVYNTFIEFTDELDESDLRALWSQHRAELLREWRRRGGQGLAVGGQAVRSGPSMRAPVRSLAPVSPARPPDTTEALLRALLEGQRALDAKVDALLARLSPGPRDRGDEQLVHVIAASTRGLTFTSQALWRHRAADPALADALATADLESPRMLGKWLRRLEGRAVGPVRIVGVGMHRDGKVWQAGVRE